MHERILIKVFVIAGGFIGLPVLAFVVSIVSKSDALTLVASALGGGAWVYLSNCEIRLPVPLTWEEEQRRIKEGLNGEATTSGWIQRHPSRSQQIRILCGVAALAIAGLALPLMVQGSS